MAMGPHIAIAIDMWVRVDGDGDRLGTSIAIGAIDIEVIANPLLPHLLPSREGMMLLESCISSQLSAIL
jgi:hypothetical protein